MKLNLIIRDIIGKVRKLFPREVGNEVTKKQFATMDYISKTLWHFVRSGEQEDSVDIFLNKILNVNGEFGIIKHNPRSEVNGHLREVKLETRSSRNMSFTDTLDEPSDSNLTQFIYEPRSVCFADIPTSSFETL